MYFIYYYYYFFGLLISSNIPVANMSCLSLGDLQKFINNILQNGGEGAILRAPASLYSPGVSDSFLKYKVCNNLYKFRFIFVIFKTF